jgi:KDO2-lipid IV(A) lauroyltransferase
MFSVFVYPALKLISYLPFPVLYVMSDGLYLLLYYIIGYRKKVVRDNLTSCFPDKSQAEIISLEKKFFKHLADMILEAVKGLSMSKSELLKRVINASQSFYDEANDKKRSSIVIMSHMGNWEWVCMSAQSLSKQKAQCIYKPLSNKNFDQMMLNMRSRFGTMPIAMEKTLRVMSAQKDITTITAFMGDQNPANGKTAWWTTFLNRDTAFMMGTEKIARKMGHDVWYMQVKKVKRGYYEAVTTLLCSNSAETKEGEITEMLVRATEQDILSQPENWLWSHRRWKHQRPAS